MCSSPLGYARATRFRKARKSAPGVAGAVVGRDLPAADLERGEQAGRAVALVVMGVALGLARAQRQHRLGAVEGLDLGLLVDAEHDRPVGRVEVEAHDIADLGLEGRVGAELEGLDAGGA